ncbi:MAG: DUF4177 domain-containing protein [Candidatus Hydrogenedentes bacterium]|nr:DUF4177 domain-containing protein [Candidatus Hydrogenedentota bacterium]
MKWEYKTAVLPMAGFLGGKVPEADLGHALAELGEEHWELVCALDTNQTYGATKNIVLLFKRPK